MLSIMRLDKNGANIALDGEREKGVRPCSARMRVGRFTENKGSSAVDVVTQNDEEGCNEAVTSFFV